MAIAVEGTDVLKSWCNFRDMLFDDIQPFLMFFLFRGPNSVHCEQDTRSGQQYDQDIQHTSIIVIMYLQSKDKKNGTSTKEHVGNLLMISTLFLTDSFSQKIICKFALDILR